MSIPTQKETQAASQPSLFSEVSSYLRDAKDSGALLIGTILSASALAGWAFAPNIKDSFESLSQYIRESAAYQTATDAGKYATHIGGKLKEAETSEILYQVVPVAVGTYFGCLGVQKLIQGVFGYDSAKMRKEFLSRAYSGMHNEKALSVSERMSFIAQATFGSISSSSRGFVLVESAARLLIAAAFIYPIFLKDQTEMPDIEKIRRNLPEMQQAQHAANVGGYSRAQTMLDSKDLFYKGLAQQWTQSINKASIDANAQKFTTDFFDAPTGASSHIDKFKSGLKSTCDWTAGFTGFADQCQSLAPEKPEALFSTSADGATTLIDKKVLDKVCSATQEFVAADPTIDSFAVQARRQLDSVCSYVNSTACHAFKDWAVPSDGTKERKELVDLTVRMCDALTTRSQYQDLFTFKMGGKSTPNSYRLGKMTAISNLLETISKRPEGAQTNFESPLVAFCRQNPTSYKRFLGNFYNVDTGNLTTAKNFKPTINKFLVEFHPDKFKWNKALGEKFFIAGETIRETLKKCELDTNSYRNHLLTPTELVSNIVNYFSYDG